jgi:hypothetical protein
MRVVRAVFALLIGCAAAACGRSNSQPARTASADSCAIVRPHFTPARAAERSIFAYDTAAPLHLEIEPQSTSNDVQRSAISFDSPGGGRATGLLFDPVTRSSPRPGIVLQHGMPSRASDVAPEAQRFAEHGAVVLALDAPFARRDGPPVFFTEQDSADQVQLMQDLQRAVDILRTRVNVDRSRIAYSGISYGGAMGSLFAGIERRLKAVVLVVGDGGLVSHFTGPEDQDQFIATLTCGVRVRWLRAMTPIEPIRFVGLAAPTPLLLQSGKTDLMVPPDDARELQRAASQPKTMKWYDAGHGLNEPAVRDRLAWLHEQIGLDAPRL